MSIAEPLYRIAFELFGATQKDRRLLQILGDKLREIDQDCLLNRLLEKIEDYPGLIVVDDVRLVHEADVLRQHGFIAVKVVADDSVRLERLKARGEEVRADEDLHVTEQEVDLIVPDWVLVNNDCTLADLKAKINELYRFLLSRYFCGSKINQP
jgi:dephospho-CoA kinase